MKLKGRNKPEKISAIYMFVLIHFVFSLNITNNHLHSNDRLQTNGNLTLFYVFIKRLVLTLIRECFNVIIVSSRAQRRIG